MHRVVITGMGVASSIGVGRPDFLQGLKDGRVGIRKMEPDADGKRPPAATIADIRDFDFSAHIEERHFGVSDRFTHMAMFAAAEALSGAGYDPDDEGRESTAVIFGNGGGGYVALDAAYERYYRQGAHRIHPLIIPKAMPSAAASLISMAHGFMGPSFAVSTACSTSNHAIGVAFQMVRSGATSVAVTGGSEGILAEGIMKAWSALRVVATDTCRPFSKNRNGMVVGEGAGAFLLETLEGAKARGAPILAEIVGFGMTADAGDLVAPTGKGPSRAIELALKDARLNLDDVDYINAHGSGTRANDAAESEAIRTVFGDATDRIAVSSTKSMHGHAIGGTGALELAATIEGMHEGMAPPTMNYEEPDPDCRLNLVVNEARAMPIRVAVSNAFAFGGLNAVLAVRQYGGD